MDWMSDWNKLYASGSNFYAGEKFSSIDRGLATSFFSNSYARPCEAYVQGWEGDLNRILQTLLCGIKCGNWEAM